MGLKHSPLISELARLLAVLRAYDSSGRKGSKLIGVHLMIELVTQIGYALVHKETVKWKIHSPGRQG